MNDFGTAISFLQFLGINPSERPFLILGLLIIGVGIILYIRISKIKNTLEKVKLNIKAIVSFLATAKPKFDSGLIEAMSPLRIKPEGYEILEKSGFKKIMEDLDSRKEILDCISGQNPTTKLDVEKYSTVLFGTLLDNKEFMNPIKTYLYNFPDHRDIFPTLAGIYIRDEYLKEHQEVIN